VTLTLSSRSYMIHFSWPAMDTVKGLTGLRPTFFFSDFDLDFDDFFAAMFFSS
jgi:hypothetical protein